MRIKIWTENEDKQEPYICKNCGFELKPEDKFCKSCGTRKGEEGMVPSHTAMLCMYGPPPIRREYICEECGHQWSEYVMFGDEQEDCPECGSKKIHEKEEDCNW